MVVSERVTLSILSDSDFNRGGIFGGQGEALPSSIIKKQRKAATSRQADSTLAALNKATDKKSAAAVVKVSEFTQLKNQVNVQKNVLSTLTRGQNLLQGASGLTSGKGILGAGLGIVTKHPIVAAIISISTVVAAKYAAQYGVGGSRDTRVHVLDDDLSNIGIENEIDIDSGVRLFLSNPLKNQGLPTGNSNNQNLRDGIRIYNLRQEGSYE